ncbi:unnamed protein product [Orchesella dallaii]|uniref:Uncharacterized protein n=1 Tax=Orchesella dallaii TaxID=48710 RepID=A0ABP1R686_9HEXA
MKTVIKFPQTPMDVFLLNFRLPQWLSMVRIRVDDMTKAELVQGTFNRWTWVWHWIGFITIMSSAVEFYLSISTQKSSNIGLYSSVYHGIVFMFRLTAQAFYSKLHFHPEDFINLFNYLGKFRSSRSHRKNKKNRSKEEPERFLRAVVTLELIIGTIALFLVSLIPATFPEIHGPILKVLTRNTFESLALRLLIFITEFVLDFPSFIVGNAVCSLTFIALNSVYKDVATARKFMLIDRLPIFHYRQLQLVVIICNECFQQPVLPLIQATASTSIISVSFFLIVFKEKLGNFARFILVSLVILNVLCLCAMITFGSMPNFISLKILGHLRTSREGKIVVGISVTALITLTAITNVCNSHSSEIVLCVNGFLQFHKIYKPDSNSLAKRKLIEKLNWIFAYSAFLTEFLLPYIILDGLNWSAPCKPSVVGYWIIPECYNGVYSPKSLDNVRIIVEAFSFFVKLSVFIANHCYWAAGLAVSVYVLVAIQILCALALKDNLDTIRKRLPVQHSRKRVALSAFDAGNQLRFIQVLAVLVNRIFRYMLLAMICGGIGMGSVSLAAMIRLNWDKSNVLSILMAVFIFINSMAVLVISVGGMVTVHLKSKELGEQFKWSSVEYKRRQRKWLSKFIKSCGFIKIYFGGNNFLEALTPVHCINFTITFSVQLLLILE